MLFIFHSHSQWMCSVNWWKVSNAEHFLMRPAWKRVVLIKQVQMRQSFSLFNFKKREKKKRFHVAFWPKCKSSSFLSSVSIVYAQNSQVTIGHLEWKCFSFVSAAPWTVLIHINVLKFETRFEWKQFILQRESKKKVLFRGKKGLDLRKVKLDLLPAFLIKQPFSLSQKEY